MNNKPGSSAVLIAFGFIATALGGVMNVIGAGLNAAEVVSKYGAAEHPGMGWIIFGAIFAAAGVVGLAAGFYKLAAAVDYLVGQRAGRLPASRPAEPMAP